MLGVLFIADVNQDEWQDVDDGASVDSVEDEAEEEAAQQDVDMVRSLGIHWSEALSCFHCSVSVVSAVSC